jgi:predicted O-methyltransferase YrrM
VPELSWQSVDDYLCAKLLPADPVLDAALESSDAAGLPPIAVAPNQGKLLQLLVRSIGANAVLEIGTLGGYSTTWMARALPETGRLVTLEFEPKHAEVARANLERAGLAERVEIRVGPALDSLQRLAEERAGPFDFVFIDADKENTRAYFERSIGLARPGSLIFVDNLVRNGHVADETSTDPQVLGMQAFLDYASSDQRVEVTAIQTVGSKGYDGFALARVSAL